MEASCTEENMTMLREAIADMLYPIATVDSG